MDESVKVMAMSPFIQKLLALMEAEGAGRPEFISLLSHIGTMERQLDEAAREVTAMRREIAALRDEQSHPLRAALNRAVERLERGIAAARARLGEIKAAVVDGAKRAAEAFKEKGISALNDAMNSIGIKEKLEGLRDYLDGEAAAAEKAIARIETMSAEYREAGKHLRNIGRAIIGKEAIQDAKPMGPAAKSIRALNNGTRAAYSGASRSAAAAIGRLEQLEKAARPSALEAMRKKQKEQALQPTGMALSRSRAAEESL